MVQIAWSWFLVWLAIVAGALVTAFGIWGIIEVANEVVQRWAVVKGKIIKLRELEKRNGATRID